MQLRSHYQKNKQCSELPFRSPCAKASLAQSVQGCATDRLALPFAKARLAFPFAKARLAPWDEKQKNALLLFFVKTMLLTK